jgi:hypothetical protein
MQVEGCQNENVGRKGENRFRVRTSVYKAMANVSLGSEGILLVELLKRDTTVSS